MSFQQGLSGLSAAAQNLEVIGNNIANAGTVGFKASEARFADLYANSLYGSTAASIGLGTGAVRVAQQFNQGGISTTDNPLDIAINGSGFFRLDNNGTIAYSRNGQFSVDKNGYVVNDAGARLTGYVAAADGTLLNTVAPAALQLSTADVAPKTTSAITAGLSLNAQAPVLDASAFNPANTASYTNGTSLSVYDSFGMAHTLSLYLTQTGANTAGKNVWQVFGTLDGQPAAATSNTPLGSLVFNSDGTLDSTSSNPVMSLSLALSNGATTPLMTSLDFSTTTQRSSSFGVNQLRQDGYATGRLSGYEVGANGVVQGKYTNGQTHVLGQVVLADFASPAQLQAIGGNMWSPTSAAGEPLVGSPGSGTLGALQASALESSNVDLTAELVNMITAQRNYQANAQTIKTQDSLMQTLVSLR